MRKVSIKSCLDHGLREHFHEPILILERVESLGLALVTWGHFILRKAGTFYFHWYYLFVFGKISPGVMVTESYGSGKEFSGKVIYHAKETGPWAWGSPPNHLLKGVHFDTGFKPQGGCGKRKERNFPLWKKGCAFY